MSMSANVTPWSNSTPAPRDLAVDHWIYHEEHMVRDWKRINKMQVDYEAARKALEQNPKYQYAGDKDNDVLFMEKDRKPIAYFCRYTGHFGPLKDYIDGVRVDNGQTVREISPMHPRTYMVGQPASEAGAPIIPLMHEEDFIKYLKETKGDDGQTRFSEVRKVTWDEMRKLK